MQKTCKFIAGSVVTICVLAAIGAVTVARYAAKHLKDDEKSLDDYDCGDDCEHCDLNVKPVTPEAQDVAESDEASVEITVDAAAPDTDSVMVESVEN